MPDGGSYNQDPKSCGERTGTVKSHPQVAVIATQYGHMIPPVLDTTRWVKFTTIDLGQDFEAATRGSIKESQFRWDYQGVWQILMT